MQIIDFCLLLWFLSSLLMGWGIAMEIHPDPELSGYRYHFPEQCAGLSFAGIL